jgi:ferredoxin-NADP reductase
VKSIAFDVPGWPGHRAGQHVDIKLTAEDGYVAQRSYSIASAAGSSTNVTLTVERVKDGEVSPFLLDELRAGDLIEVRGPIGGYFTWAPDTSTPLMLIAGGSGVVPLMSMLRTRREARSVTPARLLYSSRHASDIIYEKELEQLHAEHDGFVLTHTLTRQIPAGWTGEQGRINRDMLERHVFSHLERPISFICGPTPFVEAVTEHLIAMGHTGSAIRTERFGPTGEAK